MKKLTTSLLCAFFIFCFPIFGKTQANQNDSLALIALYNATNGQNWINTWDLTQPVSEWHGVVLDINGRVKELTLYSNELSGTIPSEIGNLTNLMNLYLFNNTIAGNIPPEIGNLASLTNLGLENNNITGTIPTEIINLTNLTNLNLYNNGITGTIPTEIGNLMSLTYLNLNSNAITGTIPTEIGILTNLTILGLNSNGITGSIPPEIGNLTSLENLGLNNNNITGNIPLEIGNLTNLTILDLNNNNITGNIPLEIGNLTSLIHLDLSSNTITGSIPLGIGNLTNLTILDLNNNNITGNIPTEIGGLTSLNYLHLNDNNITGNIPTEIGGLTSLNHLFLNNNQLSGNIPQLDFLIDFRVDYNNFSRTDIITNYSINSPVNYIYSPQYYGNEQFYTDTIGATVILFPDPPIPYNNPIVRWRKNGEFITDYTLNDTTLILTLDTLDIGVYEYHFRHSGVLPPIVEFHSLPIKNYAEGLDLEGEPIIEGELIVEYGRNRDWADIDSIRIELMSEKYNGIILDSCSCTAVHIDLWKFGPDTINDVRGILGTDGTEERRTSSVSGIDSGQHRKNIFAPDYAVGEQLLVSPHTLLSDNDTSSVVIAVIDTGINTEHFAIQSNLWTNTSELEGNNIDDDNNGYIDDIYGFDFINRAEMSDGNGHGTKVGGVIAANVPAGMNISVMPIKTFSDEGWSTLLDLICGVYYAIENEANIINISGGYKGQQSSILQRALQYGKSKNMFIIAAAGNDSLDLDIENYWPATFARDVTLLDNVFAVTAVDTNYSKVDYANYGDTTVIVAAPGQGIYAPSNIGNENYEYISGTSVSTPLVSLALAIEKLQNPNRIDDTLRAHFLNSLLKPPELADWVNGRHLLDVNIKKLPILKVFLEGAMRPNLDSMTTNLKQRGLLPGQTPLSDIVSPTPAGHPYSSPPWNYEGTEWNTISDYVEDRVDWILVSLRTEIADSTEIYCTAAQLRNDGTVIFYEPVLNLDPMPDSVYVVIEHRNHMAVMSPQKVPLIDGRIVYDFTKQDSYKKDTSVGQIEIRDGVWAMYAGDSAQENDFPFYDINGDDKAIWSMDNGIFGKYSPADYNLDGETNGADKAIWVENNGISNRVPK